MQKLTEQGNESITIRDSDSKQSKKKSYSKKVQFGQAQNETDANRQLSPSQLEMKL